MAHFEQLATEGMLCIDLAFDRKDRDRYVGYCVSSRSKEKTGIITVEIEPVFVDDLYRSGGIGSALVTRALGWPDENGSSGNRVPVSEGNEAAGNFL